jgi:predicted Zn-dependent protease
MRRGGIAGGSVTAALNSVKDLDTPGLFARLADFHLTAMTESAPGGDELESTYAGAVAAFRESRFGAVREQLIPVLAWAPDARRGWSLYAQAVLADIAASPGLPERGSVIATVEAPDPQRTRDLRMAESAISAAIYLMPEEASSWLCLAEIKLRLAETMDALNAARQAVSLRPDSAHAHALLAAGLLFAGDRDFTQALQRALELDPDDTLGLAILRWLSAPGAANDDL